MSWAMIIGSTIAAGCLLFLARVAWAQGDPRFAWRKAKAETTARIGRAGGPEDHGPKAPAIVMAVYEAIVFGNVGAIASTGRASPGSKETQAEWFGYNNGVPVVGLSDRKIWRWSLVWTDAALDQSAPEVSYEYLRMQTQIVVAVDNLFSTHVTNRWVKRPADCVEFQSVLKAWIVEPSFVFVSGTGSFHSAPSFEKVQPLWDRWISGFT